MMKLIRKYSSVFLLLVFFVCGACKKDQPPTSSSFQLLSARVGATNLNLTSSSVNVNLLTDQPIVLSFSKAVDINTVSSAITVSSTQGGSVSLQFTFQDENKTVYATPSSPLDFLTTYTISVSNSLLGASGESFPGFQINFTTVTPALKIDSLTVSGKNLLVSGRVTDVDRNFSALIKFNHAVDPSTVNGNVFFVSGVGSNATLTFTLLDSNKTVQVQSVQPLVHLERYVLTITSTLKGMDGYVFSTYAKEFFTVVDTTPKFPVVSDDELLTLVQQQTFKYFWDFGHPVSGLARERETSGDIVTIGGSGFGVMAIVVGISRNFITRQDGVDRLEKIVDFLTTANRFHGAWPHWMNGATGVVYPFSQYDDGGDLVETSYMVQGLITARQFLNPYNAQESGLISKINDLCNAVEWDWYTQGGQNVLYWQWSPDYGWQMNMPIHGYDEALISYFLAAGSPTHSINASVYTNGWAMNGSIENGNSYYGFTLPLGQSFGGPLFFAHYSFLGLNPTNLTDAYANYWEQNANHTQINRAYCIDNPDNYVGYSSQCWGLTASDNQDGYSAQSPTNDLGVITPTAAISSMPYTPEYSMDALKFFYYTIGDKTWGPYGFYDAFNTTAGWYASSDLAIDEGPIIDMIENYRTGLLWNLFMSAPEVQTAMNKLGFSN